MPAKMTLEKILEKPKIQRNLKCWDNPKEWKQFGELNGELVKRNKKIVKKGGRMSDGYYDSEHRRIIKERPKPIYNYSSHLSKDLKQMVKFEVLEQERREVPQKKNRNKKKLESWYRPSKNYRYLPLKNKQIYIIHNTPVNQVLPRQYVTYYFQDEGLTVHDFKDDDYRQLRDIDDEAFRARRILLEKVRDRKLSTIWCDKILNHDSIHPVSKLYMWLRLMTWRIYDRSRTVFYLGAWEDSVSRRGVDESEFRASSLNKVAMKLAEDVFHYLNVKKENINPSGALAELNKQAENIQTPMMCEYLIPKRYPHLGSDDLERIKFNSFASSEVNRIYWEEVSEKILAVDWYGTGYLAVENTMGHTAEKEALAQVFAINTELDKGVYKKEKIKICGESFFIYKPVPTNRKKEREKQSTNFLKCMPKNLEKMLSEFSLALGYKRKEEFYDVINEFENIFEIPKLPSIENLLLKSPLKTPIIPW